VKFAYLERIAKITFDYFNELLLIIGVSRLEIYQALGEMLIGVDEVPKIKLEGLKYLGENIQGGFCRDIVKPNNGIDLNDFPCRK
jgi:hypothetical protein